MNSKRSIHRSIKKNGKGHSRKKTVRTSSEKRYLVEKLTIYMRFFYWLYMVAQLFSGSTNEHVGNESLVLFFKEVVSEVFKIKSI